jgi:hypothetical protein
VYVTEVAFWLEQIERTLERLDMQCSASAIAWRA